jgi:hypothetical protein
MMSRYNRYSAAVTKFISTDVAGRQAYNVTRPLDNEQF